MGFKHKNITKTYISITQITKLDPREAHKVMICSILLRHELQCEYCNMFDIET